MLLYNSFESAMISLSPSGIFIHRALEGLSRGPGPLAITAIRGGGVAKRLPQKTHANNSIAASRVLSITVWISPRNALPVSQYDRDLRRVAGSLNAMPIGI